ncbi:MAG: hypothetical protein MAG453_01957 [Calditrichaeota bacterium]|nr:hypothetical protein [Calditrichota bacterium]
MTRALRRRLPVAVYDDDCAVCVIVKRRAEERLRYPVWFIGARDKRLAELAPEVTRDEAERQFVFRESDGRVYRAAAGAVRLLARMRAPWNLTGRLLMLPPLTRLAEHGYRWIADHRLACHPEPEAPSVWREG